MSALVSPRPQYFYDRAYTVEIVPYKQNTGLRYGNEADTSSQLRMVFQIERNFASAADKCRISLFNMTTANRDAIARGATVRLRAGYRGNTGLLFVGFVRKVETEQQGPDVSTTMEVGDGEPNLTYATVNRAYTEDVPLARVLQDLAADLFLDIGGEVIEVAPGVIRGIPNQTIRAGRVFEGAVKDVLDLLLRTQYIDWKIQHGKLLIMPKNVGLTQSAAVISATSGLVNTPGFTEKYMTFQSLLNTKLLPGALVQVVSKNPKATGFFKIRKATFQGDTHGQPWDVSCEAEALPQPLPFSPVAIGADFTKAMQP